MASSDVLLSDPLHCLRQAIAANTLPLPTTSGDLDGDVNPNLAIATHLEFTAPVRKTFPLDISTRFISSGQSVDLRSIFFAYQKKDDTIPDYIASTQRLNDELSGPEGAGGKVQNLVFVERLDLITWLEGAADESEYIKPLASELKTAQATGSAQVTSGAAISTVPSGAAGGTKPARKINPRLAEIYNGERRIGDRNTILRGIKPTDFSHVRKITQSYLQNSRNRQGQQAAVTAIPAPNPAVRGPVDKKSNRRPDPIILLSPSASSLLRMSNIKSFLESGVYIPPDSALAGTSNTANILHISRPLPSVDPSRPLRFILVDTPEQFKPEYWNRVVAVFTTGQTWQFKTYKWQNPPDLFRNALGIYLGWRGEDIPPSVKGWGRGVISASVDKWNNHTGVQGRWRDREVVESIWDSIEEFMRSKGWGKDGGPLSR